MRLQRIIPALLLAAAWAALTVVPVAAMEDLVAFEDAKSQLWGYRNTSGAVKITPRFRVAGDFSEHDIASVVDETGWLYIDRQGIALIRPFVFDNGPDPFQEGLARFTVNGRFGFFNERGREEIFPRYDFAAPFAEGLAAFCAGCVTQKEGEHILIMGGKWGFIDRQGVVVIAPQFEKAGFFEQGRAVVTWNGRQRVIDKQGNLLN